MGPRTDEESAFGNYIFQLRRNMVIYKNQARVMIEVVIKLFQWNTIIIAGPDHMGNQRNISIGVVQNISDQGFVVGISRTLVLLIMNDHGADIDANDVALQETLIKATRLWTHMKCRIRHLHDIGTCLFNCFVCNAFSGCDKGIIPQIFGNRRFCYNIRFYRTPPKDRSNFLLYKSPVQICIYAGISITVIVAANG